MAKNILIIGGTSGIGLAVADQLRAAGETVTITGKSDAKGALHPFFSLNVLDDEPAFADIGRIDGLVYCPGTINLKPFKSLKDDDFLNDFRVNMMGAVKVVRYYMNDLNDGASIVLFSSVAARTGMVYHTSVAAAKGAVEGFATALSAELAPRIRVNVIAPSLTKTPMAEKFINNEVKLRSATDRHPLKAIADADDIASLAVYLISPSSKFITGQVIHADGGMSTIR